jgi:dipeptidyl-peptidase-4
MKRYIIPVLLFSFVFLIYSGLFSQNGNKEFTLEDMVNNKFQQKTVRGLRSMNDGEHYSMLNGGSKIVKISYETGDTTDIILDLEKVASDDIKSTGDYQFSSDESRILLYTGKDRIYRYSFTAEYFVYFTDSKKLLRVSANGKQQIATFSPDGQKVAFMRSNNLFIKDLVTDEELQVTFDGMKNEIINGAPDWVYEEEFGFSRAYEWSPDSRFLAFMRFDESKVPEFNMTMYAGMNPTLNDNILYPENRVFKYPKAGENNSVVTVHVFEVNDRKIRKMETGTDKDVYIPRIRWTKDNSTLGIIRLNRLQNKYELLFADASSGNSRIVYTEENKYYFDESVFDDIRFLDNGTQFIFTSEKDGWNHIYLYNFEIGELSQITKGNWDVTKLTATDEKNNIIYFESAESSPLQRDVYSIQINGKGKKKLSISEGTNHFEFSKGYKYYLVTFSDIIKPGSTILYNNRGKKLRVMEDNKILSDTLNYYRFNTKELFTFKATENTYLNGWMLKPPGFDAGNKYPVFITQYSGPNSQEVFDSWELSWENYIAQKGYIIVCVDCHGTGARGEAFRKLTYKQLGKYELEDMIGTAKYLGSLPYVDKSRIGIWGWSYGGFITALCMVKGEGLFKAGIAVAPVTSWKYYDNIYTERYMRTPVENPDGYDNYAPVNFAGDMQGKLLICHGTADDNVHLQNTLEFSEKLVQADKQFEMQLYTNRNHNIYGGNTRMHLFTRMTGFLLENL